MKKFLIKSLFYLILSGPVSIAESALHEHIVYPAESHITRDPVSPMHYTVSDRMVEPSSNQTLSKHHDEILFSILNLHLEKADSLLDMYVQEEDNNSETLYLQNYLEFLEALISGKRDIFENYLENSGQRIKNIRTGGKSDENSLSIISSIHLQSTLLSVYHAENYRAARHLYHANRNLRQSEKSMTSDVRNFLNRGLITIGAGSVPDEYRWLFSIFGMKGGIKEGIGYLREYYEFTTGPRQVEACLILNLVSFMAGTEISNRDLSKECDNNSLTLFRYSGALADLSSGRSREVIDTLRDFEQAANERDLPFIDLLLGEALINSLDSSACSPLERFTQKYEGSNYRHYGWHKLSWSYALTGKWEDYRQARQEVLQSGEAYLDADRQALKDAMDTLPLNIELLKARVLYDGGYYEDALEQLENNYSLELPNLRDSIEYVYRLARIYDRLENYPLAIKNYEKALNSGSDETWYYAPNAALHLGLIHEAGGETEKAIRYYQKCLKINKSAYKKSIDYKARRGIRRIEDRNKLH